LSQSYRNRKLKISTEPQKRTSLFTGA